MTGKRIGKAAITWTSTEDTPIIERVHQLRAPLFNARPAHTLATYGGQSLDGSVVEAFTIEDGANDLVATVRLDDNPQSLIDLIKAGSRNTTLTYYPTLEDSDTSFDVNLISPRTPAEVGLDPQRANRGDRSIELRFRQTDQTAFRAEAFQGSNVLFRWKAGDELAGATFTRADDATRTLKGWGTLASTTDERPRIEWCSTAGSSGYRDTPTLLLETSQKNYVQDSEDFKQWTAVDSPALTSGQSDPYGGTNAFLIVDDSTVNYERIGQIVALDGAGPFGCSAFVKYSTLHGGSTVANEIRIVDLDNVTIRMQMQISWSSGIPTNTVYGSSYTAPEPYIGGWWRVSALTTTGVVSASSNRLEIGPGPFTATGAMYVFGAQVERGD